MKQICVIQVTRFGRVVNVSVTGAAAEATREEESLWETHEARKGGRTTFAWSSSTERTTGETKSMGKFDRTTSSHADTSDSRETGSQGLVKAATTASPDGEEREERIEMRGNALPTSRESDTGKVKTSNGRYSTVASRSMDDTGRKINLSAGETFVQSTARRPSFDKNVVFTRNFDNVSQCHVSSPLNFRKPALLPSSSILARAMIEMDAMTRRSLEHGSFIGKNWGRREI